METPIFIVVMYSLNCYQLFWSCGEFAQCVFWSCREPYKLYASPEPLTDLRAWNCERDEVPQSDSVVNTLREPEGQNVLKQFSDRSHWTVEQMVSEWCFKQIQKAKKSLECGSGRATKCNPLTTTIKNCLWSWKAERKYTYNLFFNA